MRSAECMALELGDRHKAGSRVGLELCGAWWGLVSWKKPETCPRAGICGCCCRAELICGTRGSAVEAGLIAEVIRDKTDNDGGAD